MDNAVSYMWEMIEKQGLPDLITYRTVLDETCRKGNVREAMDFLRDLQEKCVIDGNSYRQPFHVLANDFGHSTETNLLRQQVLRAGEVLRAERIFTSEDVLKYSKVSQDVNPLHFDSEVARSCGFEDRIVHGMLVASLFPRIIASHFPGAIYVSQNLQFKLPVYVGDEIVGEIQATNVRENKKRHLVKFSTKCLRNGEIVIDGDAMALLPSKDAG